ncbi:MAG: DUF938 domain-containing protein [Pseudomonadota bacterium]
MQTPRRGVYENSQHIINVLKAKLPERGKLLEIGSGTSQHAVMFAAALNHLAQQRHGSDAQGEPGVDRRGAASGPAQPHPTGCDQRPLA